jgi:hypothetical protein
MNNATIFSASTMHSIMATEPFSTPEKFRIDNQKKITPLASFLNR